MSNYHILHFRIPLHKGDSLRAHLIKTDSLEAYNKLLNSQIEQKQIKQTIRFNFDQTSQTNETIIISESDEMLKNYMDVRLI